MTLRRNGHNIDTKTHAYVALLDKRMLPKFQSSLSSMRTLPNYQQHPEQRRRPCHHTYCELKWKPFQNQVNHGPTNPEPAKAWSCSRYGVACGIAPSRRQLQLRNVVSLLQRKLIEILPWNGLDLRPFHLGWPDYRRSKRAQDRNHYHG